MVKLVLVDWLLPEELVVMVLDGVDVIVVVVESFGFVESLVEA